MIFWILFGGFFLYGFGTKPSYPLATPQNEAVHNMEMGCIFLASLLLAWGLSR